MHNNSRFQVPVIRCQVPGIGYQVFEGLEPETRNPKPGTRPAGFSVVELVIAIGLLGLLVVSVILAVNPLERAKIEADSRLKDRAENLLGAIDQFYVAEGRLPWADDLGSSSPLPGIPWTSVFSPEVGICGDKDCTTGGELITTNKLSPASISEFKGGVSIDKIYAKLKAASPLFIAKGKEPKDPIYACFIPQSETIRRATGKLYKISQAAQIPASGLPEDCPLSVSWTGDDVCYSCVSK